MKFAILKLIGMKRFEVNMLRDLLESPKMMTRGKYGPAGRENHLPYASFMSSTAAPEYGTETVEIKLWKVRQKVQMRDRMVDIYTPHEIFPIIGAFLMGPRPTGSDRLTVDIIKDHIADGTEDA